MFTCARVRRPDMRLLIICPFVPYDGIPHAGGQYVAEYVMQLLREGVEVRIACPSPDATPPEGTDGDLAPTAQIARQYAPGPLGNVRHIARHAWRAIDPGPGVFRGFEASADFRNLLGWADAIHLQYAEMMPLVPLIRDERPDIPIFCTEHDVFTQSVRRAMASPDIGQRLRALVRYAHVARREAGLLNQVDRVYVFNQQNIDLLRRMGVRTPIAPTDLHVPTVKDEPRLESNRVLFAAAFSRAENFEAAEWLVRRIWPRVRQVVPESELLLVGSDPPPRLQKYGGHGITVTGWVPSLAPYYLGASLAVAPLRRGAGVKVKVLEGMAFGLPVVATALAAEGITARAGTTPPLLLADTPALFAGRIITLLQDARARQTVGRAGKAWVRSHYDFERSVSAILRDLTVAQQKRPNRSR